MRVLSVCTSDSTGGAARAAYRIHHAVREQGIDSKMLVKYKGTEDVDVLALESFLPHNLLYSAFDWTRNKFKNKAQHLVWGKYPNRSKLYMSDLRSTDIGGAFQKIDYDILHLHWINQRFLPIDELPKDKPIVWTLHDSWPFCGVCHLPMECRGYQQQCGCCPALGSKDRHDLSYKVWKKKAEIYKHLDLHIVAPSRWIAECARKSSLFGNCDIRVIPNCIDVETFCPGNRDEACRQLQLDPGRRYLLFGAMNAVEDKNKGYDYLLRALSIIGQEILGDTDLVIFGTNQVLPEEIGGIKVRNLGLLRTVKDIVSAYRVASVTIVPSLSENLSCTIMESMACGTPVVAFDIGGNGDMIEHQVNGYLAMEKDDSDLAKGILWCLENCHQCQLCENAHNKVSKTYSPDIVGQSYRSLYSGILKSRY